MDNFDQLVAVAELADELNTHRGTVLKIAKRMGLDLMKRRDVDRGNQQISVLRQADADRIRAELVNNRRSGEQTLDGNDLPVAEQGIFYLIQLEPIHDPGRIKVGFTTDRDGRLRHHRCSAPFAEYVKSWPCRRLWERTAIDSLTWDLEQLHTEVFRCANLEAVTDRGDRFFALMPLTNGGSDEEERAPEL